MSEEVQDDGSRNSASLDESDASGAECATLDASTNISQTTISQVTHPLPDSVSQFMYG